MKKPVSSAIKHVLTPSQITDFRLFPDSKSLQTTISNVTKMEKVLQMARKHWKKQFLLFPHCFQKACTADTQQPGLVWERVKINSFTPIQIMSTYVKAEGIYYHSTAVLLSCGGLLCQLLAKNLHTMYMKR